MTKIALAMASVFAVAGLAFANEPATTAAPATTEVAPAATHEAATPAPAKGKKHAKKMKKGMKDEKSETK